MSIKPILFSAPMVQAILAGRKSMTRRVAKPQPVVRKGITRFIKWLGDYARFGDDISSAACDRKPRYQVGDVLWVRETFADPYNPISGYAYKASCHDDALPLFKWRPSIFMPYKAARIFLRVTDVRVERLQDITPHDAWLEGCRVGNSFPWEDHIPPLQQASRDMYVNLWDSLNAKRGYGWAINPWVWVYTFEPCDKPQEVLT